MLLDNYYKWRGGIQAYSHLNYGLRDIGLLDMDGNACYVYFNTTANSSFKSYAFDGTLGMRVGGTAGSISGSDYALSDDITSVFTLRATGSYNEYSTTDGKLTRYVRAMYYNGSDTDQTIRQIGLTKNVINTRNNTSKPVLFVKYNLENSITVKSGDSVCLVATLTDSN